MEELIILPLGGGNEVGRSCILLKYKGRMIFLDCGIHPGREGMDALPLFDVSVAFDKGILFIYKLLVL